MASSSRAPDQEGQADRVTEELSPTDGAASVALMNALGEPVVSGSLTDEDVAAIMSLVEEEAAIIAMAKITLDVIKPTSLISTRTVYSETHETIEFFLPFEVPPGCVCPAIRGPDTETLTDEMTARHYNMLMSERRWIPEGEDWAIIEPLEKKRSLECVPVIINGVGTLEKVYQNSEACFVIVLKFVPLKVLVRETSFYVDGHLTTTGLESFIGREVHFVATSPGSRTHSSGATYGAHFSWVGEKPSTSVILEFYKGPELSLVRLGSPLPSIIYIGIVCSNPQPDHCVVSYWLGVVYVSNECLLVDPWTKDTCDVAVSDYLKRGDVVAFTIKSEDCMEADLCGTLPNINMRSIQEMIRLDERGQSNKRKQIGGLESSLTDMLLCEQEYLDVNVSHRGVVVYLFSQQDAVALVGVIRVLINIGELVKAEVKEDDDVIGEHLEIGTPVLLRVQPQKSLDSVYYCATEAEVIGDGKEAIVLRNLRGVIGNVSDGSNECSVKWTRGGESREVESAFSILRSEAALAEYTRCDSIISCRTLGERLSRGADVSITEIVSFDEFVADVVWFTE